MSAVSSTRISGGISGAAAPNMRSAPTPGAGWVGVIRDVGWVRASVLEAVDGSEGTRRPARRRTSRGRTIEPNFADLGLRSKTCLDQDFRLASSRVASRGNSSSRGHPADISRTSRGHGRPREPVTFRSGRPPRGPIPHEAPPLVGPVGCGPQPDALVIVVIRR
jgi:hypothetical protein